MRARFKSGEKELSVSLYQAVVLLLFNDQVEIGFNDLKTTTRMGAPNELFKRYSMLTLFGRGR